MLIHNIGFWLNVSLLLTASSVNKERNQTSISWYIYTSSMYLLMSDFVLCLLKMLLVTAKCFTKNVYYVTTFNYSSGQDYPCYF